MFVRIVVAIFVASALLSGVGLVSADTPEQAKACPEDGNPSVGLEKSVAASNGQSLSAVAGINTAFASVGCETRLPI